jgi:hypothetical protein
VVVHRIQVAKVVQPHVQYTNSYHRWATWFWPQVASSALLSGVLEQIGFFCDVLMLNAVPFLGQQLDALVTNRLLHLIASHVPPRALGNRAP